MKYRNRKGTFEKKTPFGSIPLKLNPNTIAKLKAKAEFFKVPINRIVAMILDEHLDDFVFEVPDISNIQFNPGEYFTESIKVHEYLHNNWRNGVGYDNLIIARNEIGIPDKIALLMGIKELINNGQAVEVNSKFPWHSEGYKLIRLTTSLREQAIKKVNKRYKKIGSDMGPLGDL